MLHLTVNKRIGVLALGLVMLAGVILALGTAGHVKADNPVFLTRNNQVTSTYPSTNAFSVGTTTSSGATPQSYMGKLSVSLNVTDTWKKAFEIASTTGTGTATTTADLLSVTRAGCINTIATSTATPVKMVFLAVATTSSNGFVTWAYGTCAN